MLRPSRVMNTHVMPPNSTGLSSCRTGSLFMIVSRAMMSQTSTPSSFTMPQAWRIFS